MKGFSMKLKNIIGLAAAAAAVSASMACGGDDDASEPNAAATIVGQATVAPSTVTKAAYPLLVIDLLGRSVEIKAKPKTVVAVSPTAVEFVYAAGQTVVGRSQSVDFPEAAKQAKEVGTAYQPSYEAILALKPDLVVADSIIHAGPDYRKALDGLGVPVIYAGADSYRKVIEGVALMGLVFDVKDTTNKVVIDIAKARDDAKAALANKKISAVILISDRDRTLYAAKTNSYAGDILAQLGITNPAASQPDSGPFPGYTTVPPEKLLEYNPDLIFTITPAPLPAPRLKDSLAQVPPFKGLKAITGNKVAEANVEFFLQAPGPRIIDAFKFVVAAATAP
jgi:iron complex transport system substrate-binding protein